ncbi:hypothetical protein AAFN85_12930 [Mucilaginibacter sp. CAU 1740]|uniref:hypothetical protein n=1 Tax=Mucilaginibacter sp. CAU 1740 TaxID=3140365 RepID=UPI00325A5B2B
MIRRNPNFRILDETDALILGNEFEYIYLVDKKKNTNLILGVTYGDPEFGLISKNNDWCLAGGSWLFLWRKGGKVIEIEESDIAWVVKARQVTDTEVELLIDPWSENGAIWLLDVISLQRKKIRDFRKEDAFEEDFDW